MARSNARRRWRRAVGSAVAISVLLPLVAAQKTNSAGHPEASSTATPLLSAGELTARIDEDSALRENGPFLPLEIGPPVC